MAHRKKKVGAMDTTTLLLIGGGGLLLFFLLSKSNQPAAPVIVRTVSPSGSAVTAAEVSAGAGVVTTALNDIFSSDTSDT